MMIICIKSMKFWIAAVEHLSVQEFSKDNLQARSSRKVKTKKKGFSLGAVYCQIRFSDCHMTNGHVMVGSSANESQKGRNNVFVLKQKTLGTV